MQDKAPTYTCTSKRNRKWYARAYVAGRLVAETKTGRISEALALRDLREVMKYGE